jgi:flagellum-specific ATP synthase
MTVTALDDVLDAARPQVHGRVTRVVGFEIEISGMTAPVGATISVPTATGTITAEVVAIRGDELVCLPYGEVRGVEAGTLCTRASVASASIAVGPQLLGRIVDGLGRPIDGKGPLGCNERVGIDAHAPHPLERTPIREQLSLGVRAVDTLTPVGRGQRVGVFAGSGVGKSSLLSMFTRGTDATVTVLALIGERGREVREFVENDLGPEGLARSVVVVSTSDEPALVRRRGAFTATRIAEWFRDQGDDVLLMMDSLTRFAMAQREIGLAAGEPPATRGYPPSAFTLLPKLLERAGASGAGSITGLYTVLVEGDDMMDPVADAARSILDGHIVLSRSLATAGHFPSVDVLESISRLAPAVTDAVQLANAVELRRLLAAYRDARDLVEIGAYVPGTNPTVDRALVLHDGIDAFLRQNLHELLPAAGAWQQLARLLGVGS